MSNQLLVQATPSAYTVHCPHRQNNGRRRGTRAAGSSGFTLLELLIAVAVVGLLLTIALPSYQDSVRRSRRTDAVAAMNLAQQAQERWRANRTTYTDQLSNLGVSATSAHGYYNLTIPAATASGYTIVATAVTTTSQAGDGNCKVMALRMTGGNTAYGAGASTPTFPDAYRCWVRQ